jgi:hypothetical protein
VFASLGRLAFDALVLGGHRTLERVKGIEPSYSAWKSANFLNAFMGRSDILQLFDPLRLLQLFSLSE